jgi:hypothetical protein
MPTKLPSKYPRVEESSEAVTARAHAMRISCLKIEVSKLDQSR